MVTKTSSSRPAGKTADRQPVNAAPAARTDDGVTLPAAGPLDEEQAEVSGAALGTAARTALSHRSDLDQMVQEVRFEKVPEVAPPSLEALPAEPARTGVARSRKTALIAVLLAFILCAAIWPPPAAIILVGTGSLFLLVAIRRSRRPRTDPRHRRDAGTRHREPGVAFLESYLRNAGRSVDVRPVASPGESSDGKPSV